MKRFFILFFITLFLTSGISFGGELHIEIMPRIEALSILNYLAHISLWPKDSEFLEYKRDIDTYFAKINKRKHPSITMIQLLKTFGFKNEAPYLLLLHLSPPPDLKFMYPEKSYIEISKGIGIPTSALKKSFLKKFIYEFKAFYYDFNFNKFYKDHTAFYDNIKKNISDLLPLDLVSVLEGFFKTSSYNYNIYLSPAASKSYGLYIRNPYGFESFAIMNTSSIPKTERAKLEYVYQIIKELVRSFVEPIDYDYLKEIKKLTHIYSYNMVEKKLPTYKLINELMVSAVASHIMKVLYSDREEAWAIVKEERRGYYLVRPMAEFLSDYYRNLDSYKNFAAFYPKILSYLSDINSGKQEVVIPQSIGALIKKEGKDRGILLISSSELSKGVDNYINNLTELFKKKGYNISKIDMATYKKRLKKYKKRIPIVFCSADDISCIDKVFSSLTPSIELNKFGLSFLDFSYSGEYAFIIRLPNVFTDNGDMILLVANKDDLLRDINIFSFLPLNYVVLNGDGRIIREGFQKFRLR